jgi:hypothetical protein
MNIGIDLRKQRRDEHRFELTKAALNGMLANPTLTGPPERAAIAAVQFAEATLEEFEKTL